MRKNLAKRTIKKSPKKNAAKHVPTEKYYHSDRVGEKLRLTMPDKVKGYEKLFAAYAALYKVLYSPGMEDVMCSTEPTLESVGRQAKRQLKDMNRHVKKGGHD